MAGARRIVVTDTKGPWEVLGSTLGCAAAAISMFALSAYYVLAYGWVLSILWGWFVLALFNGAPVLSLPVAMGIALVVKLLTYVDTSHLQRAEADAETRIGVAIGQLVAPFFILFFGWIVHLFL